jgi:putative FmdB family regulatory protein
MKEFNMPIYEYCCTKCNSEFETLVFRSNEVVSCPKCHGTEVRKLMSACCFKTEGAYSGAGSSSGSSGCSSCSSGSCSTCH